MGFYMFSSVVSIVARILDFNIFDKDPLSAQVGLRLSFISPFFPNSDA